MFLDSVFLPKIIFLYGFGTAIDKRKQLVTFAVVKPTQGSACLFQSQNLPDAANFVFLRHTTVRTPPSDRLTGLGSIQNLDGARSIKQ